jgi:hypothetical protein
MASVLQPWVTDLTYMQQSVLLTAVRGPDNYPKYGPTKYLLRWYRRCILLSSFAGRVIDNPWESDGGSFLGASLERRGTTINAAPHYEYRPIDRSLFGWIDSIDVALDYWASEYIKELDSLPHHWQMHFMHSVEIVGYHHPDDAIRVWWFGVYCRLAHDMHLYPESADQMNRRLGDTQSTWLERADPATVT